jgi:glycosidase
MAMEGKEEPDNRRDFPGGFPGDARSVFERQGRTTTEQRLYDWTRAWIRLRKEHSAVRQGRLIDLSYDDNSYAFARQDHSETVIIAINRALTEEGLIIPAGSIGLQNGSNLLPVLGAVERSIVEKGKAVLNVPAKSIAAFKAE